MPKSRVAQTIFISLISVSLLSCGGGNEPTPTGGGETTFHDVSVSVDPSGAGTIAPSADDSYEDGETISLQAEAAEEYLFVGWSGDAESTDNPLSLTVDKDYTLAANFELKTYERAVSREGEGSVSSDPGKI